MSSDLSDAVTSGGLINEFKSVATAAGQAATYASVDVDKAAYVAPTTFAATHCDGNEFINNPSDFHFTADCSEATANGATCALTPVAHSAGGGSVTCDVSQGSVSWLLGSWTEFEL